MAETDHCHVCGQPAGWLFLLLNIKKIYAYCGVHKSKKGRARNLCEAWVLNPRWDDIKNNEVVKLTLL